MCCYLVYKSHVYLYKEQDTGLALCPSTGIWIEEGLFKGCFYLPYSTKSQDTLLPMRDSLLSAKNYQNINYSNGKYKNGLLIYPNGDIVQLAFNKKTNKPYMIVDNVVMPAVSIKNGFFRAGGGSIPYEGVNHLMLHGNSIEDIFKIIKDWNIVKENFFCFHIDDWPTIYKMHHDVPENRNVQFHQVLKCRLNNPEYFEKST